MEFDEKINNEYEVFDIDGFKVAIQKDLISKYDYLEVKYADSFVQKGFYPSMLRPEN